MPNRILRDSILTSDKVDLLDPPAEVFYRRLMSVVDDFGRFDARPSILRAACFPLRIDKVREADIPRWLAICEKAGLILLYEVAGKPYLVLLNIGAPRAQSSKYPNPPPEITSRIHLRADEIICAQTRPYSDSSADSDSNASSDLSTGKPVARKKKRAEKGTEGETPEYRQLTDYFSVTHPTYRAGREFETREGVVLADLWRRVKKDLPWAKATIDAYLADRTPRYEGHPINLFQYELDKFITRAKYPNRGSNGSSKSAARGEYPQPAVAPPPLPPRRQNSPVGNGGSKT